MSEHTIDKILDRIKRKMQDLIEKRDEMTSVKTLEWVIRIIEEEVNEQ